MVAIRHLRQLVTCAGAAPRSGARQRDIAIVHDGTIVWHGGRIVYAGPDAGLPAGRPAASDDVIDGRQWSAVPGFVDAHTHAVYAGDRRDELRRRLAGATYAEIAAQGGGILSTVAATRAASQTALVDAARPRLQEMLAAGTTTVEIKSGYGLDLESELKMLRAIAQLAAELPIDIVPTFMGAHEIPADHRSRRDVYVRAVVDEMIPAVAGAGLAEWCDVFCETGVFTPAESIDNI
jgi:imidazolonepropionase